MKYRKIQKGTVIGWDWFFVVVEAVIDKQGLDLDLRCICDNANNIYSFGLSGILKETNPHKWLIIDPKTAIEIKASGSIYDLSEEDQKIYEEIGREIPDDVIAEVLVGYHDHRFSHWDPE